MAGFLASKKLALFALLAVSGSSVVSGNPVEVLPRSSITCYADNCLRQLRATTRTALASPYCSSYYTATTTSTTVITIPALGATFLSVKKRDEATPTAAYDALEMRQAPTPTFVSKCTEFPGALSSGCSCLLGTNAATSTKTVTSTSTLALPAACSASNNYGLSNIPLSIIGLPAGLGASGLGFEVLPGGCCAYCMASPNCIAYNEDLNYIPSDPAKVACSVEILGFQALLPLGNPSCPLGIATLTQGPPESTVLYGVGLCATIVPAPTP